MQVSGSANAPGGWFSVIDRFPEYDLTRFAPALRQEAADHKLFGASADPLRSRAPGARGNELGVREVRS